MRQALQRTRAWLDVFSFTRLLVFSGFATGLLLAACSSKRPVPCTNHVRSEVTSPDGRQRAIVFHRICPADGSVSTDISIVGVDEALPDRNGNVYATDRDIAIRVAWVSENRLAVYSFADLSKGTRLEQAGSVSIEYSRVMEADLLPSPESSPSPTAGTP
ncbi:MAG: hypothetical protein WB586_18885 [Chthoniobacterales bacterium]